MSIDDRLDNWSRQYRERLKYECCASIEGRMYHAPWRQWVQLGDIQHSVVVDWRDAELVEEAWRSMLGKHKLILKYTYMSRMPQFVIARKSHIPVWKYSEELRKAKNIIEKLLDIHKAMCHDRVKSDRESERIHPTEVVSSRLKESIAA